MKHRHHDIHHRLVVSALTAGLLGAVLFFATGCGEKSTVQPSPLTSTLTGVEGNLVQWSVAQPTRGSVRYGFASGQYDRIAYPTVSGGGNKAYRKVHEVPLLSASAGATIYIQRVDVKSDGGMFAAAEETVLVESLAARPPLLQFTAIDVQFGDAHVMRLPTADKSVIIDGGNPSEGRGGQSAPAHVLSWLRDHGITHLDVALVSHLHTDHFGGLVRGVEGNDGILDLLPLDLYVDTEPTAGSSYHSSSQAEIQALMDRKGTPRPVIHDGETSKTHPEALGWDPLVTVKVLNAGPTEVSLEGGQTGP